MAQQGRKAPPAPKVLPVRLASKAQQDRSVRKDPKASKAYQVPQALLARLARKVRPASLEFQDRKARPDHRVRQVCR